MNVQLSRELRVFEILTITNVYTLLLLRCKGLIQLLKFTLLFFLLQRKRGMMRTINTTQSGKLLITGDVWKLSPESLVYFSSQFLLFSPLLRLIHLSYSSQLCQKTQFAEDFNTAAFSHCLDRKCIDRTN